MDFRNVDARGLKWAPYVPRRAGGKPGVSVKSGEGKVTVQTPLCACTVTMSTPGMYRLRLSLRQDVAAHREFSEWLCAVEESAREAASMQKWREGRSLSTSLYNGVLQLTAFSDTLAFDSEGKMSVGMLDARACACIVELQGCWQTDSRWGLRWRIAQLKWQREPPTLPSEPRFVAGDDEEDEQPTAGGAAGGAAGFQFLADE